MDEVGKRLPDEDRDKAHRAIPSLKAASGKRGPNYRPQHAATYLNQRRFDGLLEKRASNGAADQWGDIPAVIAPVADDFFERA